MKLCLVLPVSVIALAVASCLPPDDEAGDPFTRLRSSVQEAIVPEARIVWEVAPIERPEELKSYTWSLSDGASLVLLRNPRFKTQPDPTQAIALHIASSGEVTAIQPESETDIYLTALSYSAKSPKVIRCGDEALVQVCDERGTTIWVTDLERGTLRRAEESFPGCQVFGSGFGEGFGRLHLTSQEAYVSKWSCADGKLKAISEPVGLPWMASEPVFFEEVEPGVFGYVHRLPSKGDGDLGTWRYEQSDGKKTFDVPFAELPFPLLDQSMESWERVRRESSGALLFDGISELHRFHIESDGSVELLGKAPAGDGNAWRTVGLAAAIFSKSEPNPELAKLDMPISYSVRLPSEEGYRTIQAPSTPCATRESCRNIGESYLQGVVDTASGPLGVYLLWTWELDPRVIAGRGSDDYLAALVVAPLDRPLP